MNETNLIPPPRNGSKYNLDELIKYGDNVFVKTHDLHKVRDAAYKYAKYKGFKVATRIEDDGLRIYHAGE